MLCPARGDQCLRRVVGRFEQSLCRADDRLSLRRRQRWRFDSCASSSQIAFVRWIGDQADSLRFEIALRTAEFILAMIETWNHVAGPGMMSWMLKALSTRTATNPHPPP